MTAELKVAASTEIKIEKGVSFPTSNSGSPLPWGKLEIGDSFAYPHSKQGLFSAVDARNARATNSGSPVRFKGSSRGGELRVWRIA